MLMKAEEFVERYEKAMEERKKKAKYSFVSKSLELVEQSIGWHCGENDFPFGEIKDGKITAVSLPGYSEHYLRRKDIPFLQEEIDTLIKEVRDAGYKCDMCFYELRDEEESPNAVVYLNIGI